LERDAGDRRCATTEEFVEIRELKSKVRRLEEDLETAKASIFFAGRSTPEAADRGVHRLHAQ
jgi:hypothetical protein